MLPDCGEWTNSHDVVIILFVVVIGVVVVVRLTYHLYFVFAFEDFTRRSSFEDVTDFRLDVYNLNDEEQIYENENYECVICMDEFKTNERTRVVKPCNHFFHTTWLFSPLKLDLSNSGLKGFKQPEFERYGPKSSEIESKNASKDIPNKLKEQTDAPLVKDRVADNKDCLVESPVVVEKQTDVSTIAKVEVVRPKQQQKNQLENQLSILRCTGHKGKFYTARPRAVNTARPRAVNTARPNSAVVNAVRVNQIQALVDKKKVIITEASVRSDLHLEDAEGTECLSTATIFEQLTLTSAKTTAWNEFSSTMASAIICLATNQKFNFSIYIFDHMVKNLEDRVKFLMFPRFVKVFLDSQVEGMLKHKEIYVTPSYTKKIFANMKRHGKDFSGKVTPLFETMMVQPQEDMGEDLEIPIDSHHTPTANQPSTSSQPQQKQKFKKSKKKITEVPQLNDSTHDVADEHVTTTSNDPLSGEDRLKLTELIELCTHLQLRFLALETTKANQALEIESLKRRVKKLKKKANKKSHKLKRLYKIGSSTRVESSEDAGLGYQEDASKQGRMIDDLDADEGVTLVDETQGRNDQDMSDTSIFDDKEVVAEKELLFINTMKWIESFVPMDTELVKGSEKAAGSSEKAAEGSSKRAAVPDNDDDVTIKATPLSSKSPTIVDYKIYKERRKSFFKIIRADGNSQNYLTFGKMFKNFNREDLEVLWSIVKARFKKTNPVDDMDNLLFQTLKTMFEHHVEDNICKYQQGTTKVLNWELFYSCGVYCVTTQNMVYYLLVEKMYSFTRNILHQMWNNVRLQVDYEVEMEYDLLRLIRRQISEGYVPE
nr:ribonuclease H-like domain, reverse transcriptase, RNA-dependent DNA polymerase [Tanacetum cinerariifolium]